MTQNKNSKSVRLTIRTLRAGWHDKDEVLDFTINCAFLADYSDPFGKVLGALKQTRWAYWIASCAFRREEVRVHFGDVEMLGDGFIL